jgi:hypothetical protein
LHDRRGKSSATTGSGLRNSARLHLNVIAPLVGCGTLRRDAEFPFAKVGANRDGRALL